MKFIAALFVALSLAVSAQAQTIPAQPTTLAYDFASPPTTLSQAQSWQPVLYVNGLKAPDVVTGWSCTQATPATLITCTFLMPVITAQVTPSGNQTLEIAVRDLVFGESPKSSPLVLVRPPAPTTPRRQ